jgi:hypothetical protein
VTPDVLLCQFQLNWSYNVALHAMLSRC